MNYVCSFRFLRPSIFPAKGVTVGKAMRHVRAHVKEPRLSEAGGPATVVILIICVHAKIKIHYM